MFWFLAVLTELVRPETSYDRRASVLAGMVVGPVCCFAGLSVLVGRWESRITLKAGLFVDRVAGAILIAIGVVGLVTY